MNLRFCVPQVSGRGAGLGNELLPWARAHLMAQVLGARALPPAFGLNPRRYGRHFGTAPFDWLYHRALAQALPVVDFGEADFYEHGGGDVLDAFRRFAAARRLSERQALVVRTGGMWGGYRHVAAARRFVLATLHASRHAQRNLQTLARRLDPARLTVGMHVRLGDFTAPGAAEVRPGQFNVSIPIEWYGRVARSLVEQLGDRLQFLVASDGTAEQLRPLTEQFRCVPTLDIPDGDCSDLLALARSDLLVCSVSSYSAWAAALSGAPYLWFEPNLYRHQEGYYSIWGHETRQRSVLGETRRALQTWSEQPFLRPRGWPTPVSGEVPGDALATLRDRCPSHRAAHNAADLVHYGVVPAPPVAAVSATPVPWREAACT